MPPTQPSPPPQFSPLDITKGFVDAINIWSEFLKGNRGKQEWGVYGAFQFLSSIGFDIPTVPISTDDMRRLEVLAETAERMRNNRLSTTTRDLTRLKAKMRGPTDTLSQYFEANCNVAFSVDLDATGQIENACDSVDTAVSVFQSQYDTVDGMLDSYSVGQSSPMNDYSQIPPELDAKNTPSDEYAILNDDIDTDYWEPPAPEHFDTTFGAVPD